MTTGWDLDGCYPAVVMAKIEFAYRRKVLVILARPGFGDSDDARKKLGMLQITMILQVGICCDHAGCNPAGRFVEN